MAIPKIIHYCWFGGKEKPTNVLRCIESWRKYCPDYIIKEWNESNLNIKENQYTRQAYEAKAWGFVPDYLRLWIIYNYGGIYLDTDVQIVKSFDSLLSLKAFAGFEDSKYVNLGQGFGAEKYFKLLKFHMDLYEHLIYRNEDDTYNRKPSPQYTTDFLKNYGLQPNNGMIQNIDGLTIFPQEYFCPKDFRTGITKITKATYSIHQFDASWYSPEEQKQRRLWERAARRDYWIHTPNRVVKLLMGEKKYEKLKEILKNKDTVK